MFPRVYNEIASPTALTTEQSVVFTNCMWLGSGTTSIKTGTTLKIELITGDGSTLTLPRNKRATILIEDMDDEIDDQGKNR